MRWRFAAASRVGTSHERVGLACQDGNRCEVVPTDGGPTLVAVISDGAGSASEGAAGSRFVCDELVRRIRLHIADGHVNDPSEWLKKCIEAVRTGLVTEADRLGVEPREMAATLLCAVLAGHWSAFAQIGDGAIVTSERDTGEWSWLVWPQRGEYANTTSFVTDPAAMDIIEIETLGHGLDEIALFTDGLQHLVLHYAQQRVHSPFFERMIGPVRRSSANGEDRALSAGLDAYLGTPAVIERTDDDLTLVMASRVPG